MDPKKYSALAEDAIAKFSRTLPAHPAGLYEPIRYALAQGGKRMRPVLALLGAGLFREEADAALPAAVGIELFHNFTLLHDDIMDNALLRRGKPSVHVKWNNNTAILSGDAMFAAAFREISKSPAVVLQDVLGIFTKTTLQVCEGQQLDMDFENAQKVLIPDYLHMIELKTAVLLAASLQIGALCGGAPKSEAEKLFSFGKHTGIAFQLQDDILDVYGEENVFGKKPGGDIVANKKTFLLLKAFERANRYQQEELHNWLLVKSSDAEKKIEGVKAMYDLLGVRDLAREEMNRHYKIALAALEDVVADGEKKKALMKFTDELMVREV